MPPEPGLPHDGLKKSNQYLKVFLVSTPMITFNSSTFTRYVYNFSNFYILKICEIAEVLYYNADIKRFWPYYMTPSLTGTDHMYVKVNFSQYCEEFCSHIFPNFE